MDRIYVSEIPQKIKIYEPTPHILSPIITNTYPKKMIYKFNDKVDDLSEKYPFFKQYKIPVPVNSNCESDTLLSCQDIADWKYTQSGTKTLLSNSRIIESYSGSGVIILLKSSDPIIMLGKTQKGSCEDFGGTIDNRINLSDSTIKHNARKELLEESQNMFILNNVGLNNTINNMRSYFDIIDNNKNRYRSYVIGLNFNDINQLNRLFHNNRMILSKMNLGEEWNETTELRFFKLSSLKPLLLNTSGSIICNDINGMASTIRDRTADLLRKILTSDRILADINSNWIDITPKNMSNGIQTFII